QDNTIVENKPSEAPKTQQVVAETSKPAENNAGGIASLQTQVENKMPVRVDAPKENTETVKKEESIKAETVGNNNNINFEEFQKKIEQLTSTISELKADKEQREKTELENKEKSKRELIEKYVTSDTCSGNEEERERRIKGFMHLPVEELEYFL